MLLLITQWRIQGRPGGRPLLFSVETEVRRAEKIIFGDRFPLSKGMDDRSPLIISRSRSGTVSGILATLVVPSKWRPSPNTLGTGRSLFIAGGGSPEGGRGGGGEFWAKQGEI